MHSSALRKIKTGNAESLPQNTVSQQQNLLLLISVLYIVQELNYGHAPRLISPRFLKLGGVENRSQHDDDAHRQESGQRE